ncbi:MAG TPA: transglycosylase domain-containing protein [Thermoleophilaceae bacterium]|nr:transglycosylase domain-containing protein [Thermoleophilaceae bacterium]
MTYRQRQSRRRRRGGTRSKLLLGLGVLAMIALIGVLSAAGYVFAVAATAPDLSELKPINKGQTSVIYAADGSRLGYVQSDEVRTPLPWGDLPLDMRNATVAIEDERFYHHKGVDYNGIVRAGVRNLESGKTVQGGSTITQQLVRALYIRDPKRDFNRKIREAKLASELEKHHSKQWILQSYLNSVPYGTVGGRTAIGVEAAAETFFAKHAKDLTLDEAALIAGLPQAPSQYNPFRNPTAAIIRRNEVLRSMVKQHMVSQAEAAAASQQSLRLKHGTRYTTRREPYFFDYVQERLIERYGVGVLRRGGLKVHTTIEPKMQEAARKAIAGQLPFPTDPSSAIVSIDPANGYIRAMASSGTYRDRTFNLAAQGHRQPGSSFKTMVLTTAIRLGVNPNTTTYTSKPLNLNVPGYGPWQVKTYSNSYGGTMNLVQATLKSDNTVYAQLILDVGPKEVCKTAHMLGITTHLDCLPAEGLGGLRLGVSPLEMADAYATLADGGVRHRPEAITKVDFPDGKSDDLGKPKSKRVISDGVAYEVTKILKQNVQSGTGTHANIGCPAAGKTGTTDNFNDAWFVGYTPHLASSVWVGYPNALVEMRSVHGIEVAGGTFPAQIWHDYMNVAKGSDCSDFPQATTPVHFTPFYGKFSHSGSRGYGGTTYSSPNIPGSTTGGTRGRYNPQFYEAPPQPEPKVAPPPSPKNQKLNSAPTGPTPGNGHGNGNGNGNGNGGR